MRNTLHTRRNTSWTDVVRTKRYEYLVLYLDERCREMTFGSCATLNKAIELEKEVKQQYKNTRIVKKITIIEAI